MIKEIERAKEYSLSGDHKAALRILKQILVADPKNVMAWVILAGCIDDEKKALECLHRAHDLDPANKQVKDLLREKTKENRKELVPQQELTGFFSDKSRLTNETDEVEEGSTKTENLPIDNDVIVEDKATRSKKNQEELISHTYHFSANEKDDESLLNSFCKCLHQIDQNARDETGIYGKSVIVAGIKIVPEEAPPCLHLDPDFDDTACDSCDYFSEYDCLLKTDVYLVDDLNRITLSRVDQYVAAKRRKNTIVKIVYEELRAHGRPLHYSVIKRIVDGRYPKLKVTEDMIYHLVYEHSDLFERIDNGVYKAR
ncbi:MAG: tetratricopeptide repeat protein [Smithella sp.]